MARATGPGSGNNRNESVAVESGTIGYESAGRGPPVLFLHAAIADRRMWGRELRRHQDHHRVVTVDLRGYGHSSAASAPFAYTDDFSAVARQLGLDRPLVVGCSMGGAFAIDYALAHPADVGGLLLVAPGLSNAMGATFSAAEQRAFADDEARSKEVTEAWTHGDRTRAVDLLRALWCAALSGESLALFQRMVEQNLSEVFDNRSAKLARDPPPAYERLGTIQVPTTVMVGDRDNPASPVIAKRIAEAIPRAQYVVVPGADHLVNLSQPEAFDVELLSLLGRVRPR